MVTFVILRTGRTGSEHLVSLLDSHPEIRCFGELFAARPGFQEHYLASGEDDPLRYLDDLTREIREPQIGLKLPWNSVTAHPEALAVLHEGRRKVIRLWRRDRVAQYVSQRLAAKTGVAQSTRGSYGEATVRIDPDRCIRAVRALDFHNRMMDALSRGNPIHRLTYEELAAGRGLVELQRFLEVASRPLTSRYEQLGGRPLPEVVENWEELEGALSAAGVEVTRDPGGCRSPKGDGRGGGAGGGRSPKGDGRGGGAPMP